MDAEGTHPEGLVQDEQGEELLRLMAESVPDHAILLLDASGLVRTWPPAAERLNGWAKAEILGRHLSSLYLEEDVRRGKPGQDLDQAAREGRFEEEGWRRGRNGDPFWANEVLVPLRDGQGRIRGYGAILRDLTERRLSEDKIRRQAREIVDMTLVPIVQVWEGVVLVPLIGNLDASRAQQLMERLLQRVTETRSPVAVIDITGVPDVDTQTAQHLIETVSAVRLLGADVIMTGIRPGIAQTLVHLGIDLSSVATRASLVAGLKLALESQGLKVVPSRADG